MPALNFKAQFAPLVERGEKRQTIRRMRKRPIRKSDRLALYTGMRTKACRLLRDTICVEVMPISIFSYREDGEQRVVLDGHFATASEVAELAYRDGFRRERPSPLNPVADVEAFFAFFVPNPGDRFHGQLIRWQP